MIDLKVGNKSVATSGEPDNGLSESTDSVYNASEAARNFEAPADVQTATPEASAAVDRDSVNHLTAKVARGSSWVLAGSLVGRIVQFALHVVLSRFLGASSYGLYAMGRSVMHVVQQVGGLGLSAGIVRFAATEYGQDDQQALKGTLVASLLIGGAASTVLALLLFMGAGWISVHVFNEPNFTIVLQVFSVSLPFYTLNFLASRAARAFQRMKHDVVIGTIAQPALNLVLVACAFALGFGLGGAVYAFLFAMIISAVVGVYFVGRLFPPLFSRLRPSFSIAKLMKYSLLVLGAGISTLLLGETDRLMLGMLATAREVGVYNVAVLVSTQMVFFLTAVNSSFMPMIADLYHRNRHTQLQDLFRTTTRWVFTFSLPLLVILLLFPAPVLKIFGSEFAVAAPALTILALAYFIDASVGAVGFLLQMSDYHHVLAINNVIMAVVNVLLNLWLIPIYGIAGAAMATGLAIASINVVKLIEVRFLLDMHPYDRSYWKPLLAGTGAMLVGVLFHFVVSEPLNWLLGTSGALLTYAGLLFLFGAEPKDRFVLETLLRKKTSPLHSDEGSPVFANGQPDKLRMPGDA